MPSTMKLIRLVLSAAAVVVLFGCGAAPTTATTSVPDLPAARATALTLFVAGPAGHWGSCAGAAVACPLTASVQARLDALRSQLYFSDGGGCGEDYITATQNGFNNAPQVLSADAATNGSVTVVMQRDLGGKPNLSAVMTETNGKWLASDLASGTGPSASIFSVKPNC